MKARPKADPVANRVTGAHESALAAHEQDQLSAARVVASRATGVEDCAELLGMLGLARAVGLPVTEAPIRH
ncbi:hypothetical protein Acsp06_12420 [Actinomycetospora sp. NBRC 106375]|uniref:hypothetical protein n=1 Tax=Actinomycetospora sp. NBRC 106375 TaxID=3032207 RepID=UPI0024A2F9CD|nr:hypothetical protein [Actinomycetospora sp. NBRC 106375]GLZ45057.1 hypothetical protein Acsp06_12420 [Actinomycetospora sp. NBRC 106375]